MISATVAPERRWRMSITCLSRRERAVLGAADSDLLAISVTLISERLEETSSWELYVEKSTVLKIQQPPRFVNRQLFRSAAQEVDVAVDGADSDHRAAAANRLMGP